MLEISQDKYSTVNTLFWLQQEMIKFIKKQNNQQSQILQDN